MLSSRSACWNDDADAIEHEVEDAYTCVLWNAVPRDWEQPETWVGTALEQIEAQPWSLVVLHDIIPGNDRQAE